MKLEYNHLVPYLPFDLKIKWNDSKDIYGINFDSETDYTNNLYPLSTLLFSMTQGKELGWKPVLKPKTFLHELQDEIYIRWGGGISKKAKGYWLKEFTDNLMYTAYPKLNFDEIEFMAEYHIDIFDLINQGLAVAE